MGGSVLVVVREVRFGSIRIFSVFGVGRGFIKEMLLEDKE